MATESRLRANNKYRKKAYKQYLLRLNINYDKELIDRLESVDNKANYLKTLISNDIKHSK